MPSSAPSANVAFVVEAISGLQRLQREMARLSQGDENYESKKRALQTAIQELRKMISGFCDSQARRGAAKLPRWLQQAPLR